MPPSVATRRPDGPDILSKKLPRHISVPNGLIQEGPSNISDLKGEDKNKLEGYKQVGDIKQAVPDPASADNALLNYILPVLDRYQGNGNILFFII